MTIASTTTIASVSLSRDEDHRLFGQTMGLVAVTAALFAVGAYVGRDATGGWAILGWVSKVPATTAISDASYEAP